MQHNSLNALAAILLAVVATSGCGLKGALTLPSKSDEVVIRASETAPAEGETPATPSATTPAEPVPETPAKPRDERIPPPPLPGGKPGTARGG
jgi:predicted small lipoprotein YifL